MTAARGRAGLIVNADDLGLAASVNRGIVETMRSGIVRSASLMVNLGGHDDAVLRLREVLDAGIDVGIGLHVNLVAGRPLTAARTLADSRHGGFLPLAALALRAFTGRIGRHDVAAELEAQLDKAAALLQPLGLRVTHVDSHRHAHCLPGIFDVVLDAARARGIHHVRRPRESLIVGVRAGVAAALLRVVLHDRPALDDVGFTGFALMGSRTLDADLRRLIRALPSGTTELMVHPGYDSPELAALDPYRAPREREVAALTQPALAELLRNQGTELRHFGATAPPA